MPPKPPHTEFSWQILGEPIADAEFIRSAKLVAETDGSGVVALVSRDELRALRQRRLPSDSPEWLPEEIAEAAVDPALPLMQRAIATRINRRGAYGASEQKFANVMSDLFPNGLHLQRRQDWVRFGIFFQIISKICRYSHNPYQGHVDSMHDLGPYAHMLEAEDRRDQGLAPFERGPNPEDKR